MPTPLMLFAIPSCTTIAMQKQAGTFHSLPSLKTKNAKEEDDLNLSDEQKDYLKPLVTIPYSYNSVQIASAAAAAIRKAGYPLTASALMAKYIGSSTRESALNLAKRYCIVKEV